MAKRVTKWPYCAFCKFFGHETNRHHEFSSVPSMIVHMSSKEFLIDYIQGLHETIRFYQNKLDKLKAAAKEKGRGEK